MERGPQCPFLLQLLSHRPLYQVWWVFLSGYSPTDEMEQEVPSSILDLVGHSIGGWVSNFCSSTCPNLFFPLCLTPVQTEPTQQMEHRPSSKPSSSLPAILHLSLEVPSFLS